MGDTIRQEIIILLKQTQHHALKKYQNKPSEDWGKSHENNVNGIVLDNKVILLKYRVITYQKCSMRSAPTLISPAADQSAVVLMTILGSGHRSLYDILRLIC